MKNCFIIMQLINVVHFTFLALRTIWPMFKVIFRINNYMQLASYLITLDLEYHLASTWYSTPAVQLLNAPESNSELQKIKSFLGHVPRPAKMVGSRAHQVPCLLSMSRNATDKKCFNRSLLLHLNPSSLNFIVPGTLSQVTLAVHYVNLGIFVGKD